MMRIFTDDTERDALLAACDAADIDAPTSTELLNAVEEARCLDTMLDMFKQGRVRPVIEDGKLLWRLSDSAKCEYAEKFAAMVLRNAGHEVKP